MMVNLVQTAGTHKLFETVGDVASTHKLGKLNHFIFKACQDKLARSDFGYLQNQQSLSYTGMSPKMYPLFDKPYREGYPADL